MKGLHLSLLASSFIAAAMAQRVGTPTDDLTKLGVDELFSVQVTSVGRKAQQISKAPASVFVLTAEDIRRSGATSIPEALQWVPGLTVLSVDGRSWAISIRGSARMYADRILVMIDGRSLYTPLFSGVIWDAIDVPMNDIEQIEVVRGPGAVMWGPNAVNGMINVITKRAQQTKGGQVSASTGNENRGGLESRWGAAPSDRVAYRVWGKLDYRTPAYDSPGVFHLRTMSYLDPDIRNLDTATGRLGFRVDGQPNEKDQWMIQGNLFKTDRQDPTAFQSVQPVVSRLQAHSDYSGGYLQTRWTRTGANGSESVVQLSYDRNDMDYSTVAGVMQNLTLDFQKRMQTGEGNEVYWGAGFQQYWDQSVSRQYISFNPSGEVIRSGDVVLRDEWQAVPGLLTVSAGVRVDFISYDDVEYQPSFRLMYTPTPSQWAWFAISRAVRTPNRADRDMVVNSGNILMPGLGIPVTVLGTGSKSMKSEAARTAEGGYRFQAGQRWSVDASAFFSVYERLRSIDFAVAPQLVISASGLSLLLPMHPANSGAGQSYGGEVSSTIQVRRGWRLVPGYSYVKDDRCLPASSPVYTYSWDHMPSDLRHQGTVRSEHDLARNWQLDLMARARSRDLTYGLPGVMLIDARLNWHPVRGTEIGFTLHNLANRQVFETFSEGVGPAVPIRRTFLVQWMQRFRSHMRNLHISRWWLGAGLIALLAGLASGAADPEDELKAATVLTFVRHTVWLQGDPTGPITIGVTGRPSMIRTLQRTLDGKTANNRAIHIVDARVAAELSSCQVLYVATDDNSAVRQTLAGVRSAHALTIGETGRFLEDGGAVNLLFVDGHMSFEVSVEALDRAGVSISSTLLRYGQVKVEAARMKRYSSLRRKLMALIAGGGIVSALIAAAGFSWLDVNRFWQNTNARIVAIASIVADQAEPAIALGDRKAASEILNSLRADPSIRDAVLYDPRGLCFARANERSASCPALPPDGLHREHGAVFLARSIRADGERQGTLVIWASVPSMAEVLRQYLGGAALIIALSLVVAAILAVVLQARVSTPILAIAQVAERISQTHQFQDRVEVTSGDELGVLAQSFNSMLNEIARRDAKLEQEIVERQRVNVELRSAKERAEEAARLKSEFLANMSHEIRTPMNGVAGMISLVLDRTQDPEAREQLLVAQNAAQALITILNDILDLSKIEAGKLTIEAIPCDLPAMARDCLRMFEFAVRQKPLDLCLVVDPGCPVWVRADPVRLRQVLLNLVGNAVKFTSAGSVTVTLAPQAGDLIRFEVRDTGIGIAADKLHAIFDAFTQADGSHTRQFGGTGLGLTITRRLVQLMGGRLWAESEPGQGSRFVVELALTGAHAPQVEEKAAVPAVAPGAGLRVLVAEDNPINQKVVCSMLRRQGWNVTLAVNGVEACRCFLENSYDLVLLDVQMPEMDGLEAARRIRAEEVRRGSTRTPILALTAHASQSQREQCLQHGMDSVITKPVNLPGLLREISAVVGCPV